MESYKSLEDTAAIVLEAVVNQSAKPPERRASAAPPFPLISIIIIIVITPDRHLVGALALDRSTRQNTLRATSLSRPALRASLLSHATTPHPLAGVRSSRLSASGASGSGARRSLGSPASAGSLRPRTRPTPSRMHELAASASARVAGGRAGGLPPSVWMMSQQQQQQQQQPPILDSAAAVHGGGGRWSGATGAAHAARAPRPVTAGAAAGGRWRRSHKSSARLRHRWPRRWGTLPRLCLSALHPGAAVGINQHFLRPGRLGAA